MNTFKQESDKYLESILKADNVHRNQLLEWGQEDRVKRAEERFKSYLEQTRIYLGDNPPMGVLHAVLSGEYKTEIIEYLTERINRL